MGLLWAMAGSVAEASVTVCNRRLEKGQTVLQALVSMGVDAATASRVVDALDDVIDMRRLRAGQQLRLVRRDGEVVALDVRAGPVDELQVWREELQYVAARRAFEVEQSVARYDFDVQSTLWKAALERGTDSGIALALSDAFGWELDLMRDSRMGDRAKVLVETLVHDGRVVRYGQVLAARYERPNGKRVEVFRYEQATGRSSLFFKDGTSAQRTFLKSPAGWAPLTSRYGWRVHPVEERPKFHDGLDYAMPIGTPVRAVAAGLVTVAGYSAGGGNTVCVEHEGAYQSCYLHLSRLASTIHSDEPVAQRQIIGWSGNTGNTTAPHLHFSMKRNGRHVNPLKQNYPRTESVPRAQRAEFRRVVAERTRLLDDEPVAVELR